MSSSFILFFCLRCDCINTKTFFLCYCLCKQEHFYDPTSNSGFLAWRLKTLHRNSDCGPSHVKPKLQISPTTARQTLGTVEQLSGDECMEAISMITHLTDTSLIKDKMKATFEYRQKLVHNKNDASSVFTAFPRFLDTPGLVNTILYLYINIWLSF